MKNLLCLLILAFSLVTGCASERSMPIKMPIKIGLLADSQITCPSSTPECLHRNKSLDEIAERTIRPPALESCYFKEEKDEVKKYFAEELLDLALEKLESEDVNVILYLGDGANSGGQDEIDTLTTTLKNFRIRSKIPIFMVIGNHDYLGVGNTPNPAERLLLLNRFVEGEEPPFPYNHPLSKYEVLERISQFNHRSAELNEDFKYQDNFDTDKKRFEQLDNEKGHEAHKSGLYLAGYLEYPAPNSVEIFLADTSDYNDTPLLTKPEQVKFAAYGLTGSISSKDNPSKEKVSQISYFCKKSTSKSADFRFVASHYHPDNVDRTRLMPKHKMPESWGFELENFVWQGPAEIIRGVFGSRHANRYLKCWLAKHKRNYWLSAHTHRCSMMYPNQGKVHVGGILEVLTDASFHSVNIGSTTDFRAHVAVVEAYEKGKNTWVDKNVGFREIPLFKCNKGYPQEIFSHIKKYGNQNRNKPPFKDVKELKEQSDKKFGITILGLNKEYRKEYWETKHTEASFKNLGEFIKEYSEDDESKRKEESKRKKLVACLGFIAGAYEEGRITEDDDPDWNLLKELLAGELNKAGSD